MPSSSAVRRRAETRWFAVLPIDNTVDAAIPPRRSATGRRYRRRAFQPPSGSVVFRRIPHALDRVLYGRLVIRETLQTGLSSCIGLGSSPARRNAPDPDSAVSVAVRSRLLHSAGASWIGHFHQAEPSSHLPLRTVTAARMHIGSRLTARPSTLRPEPSRLSLLRRRSTSVGTVVRAKATERRADWRCRSPLRKDALVSDFAVCARNLGCYSKRRSAWKSVPSGGAVRMAPGVHRFPWRRNASDPSLAVGTDLAAVRVGINHLAGKIRRGIRFFCAVRALGSSSARLRNAAHCQGLPRAEARLVPFSRLVAGNASSPVIAERRRSIRRSSCRSLELDSSTRDEPKRQSELPHCKQQGWRKGRGFFHLLARSRQKPRPPTSSPKTRRWVRARGKGPDAFT